jgi:Uma2 family endonuclease
MVRPAEHRMTIGEFLTWNDGTSSRYELRQGSIVAMAPPSGAHSRIAGTLARLLGVALKGPCGVFSEAGILLEGEDTYYHADLAVSCAPTSARTRGVPDPLLLVEIISPSTSAKELQEKLQDYRSLASVQEILLVSSSRHRVELHRRSGERWVVEDFVGLETSIGLESARLELRMSEIYEGVEVEASRRG